MGDIRTTGSKQETEDDFTANIEQLTASILASGHPRVPLIAEITKQLTSQRREGEAVTTAIGVVGSIIWAGSRRDPLRRAVLIHQAIESLVEFLKVADEACEEGHEDATKPV